jgi:hypothetical protein
VLAAVTGPSAVLPVVVGNLVSSLVLLPVTLALLEAGKNGNRGHQGLTVIWRAVLGSIRQPLVIAPVVGVVVALLGWHPPEAIHNSLTLMGDASIASTRQEDLIQSTRTVCTVSRRQAVPVNTEKCRL